MSSNNSKSDKGFFSFLKRKDNKKSKKGYRNDVYYDVDLQKDKPVLIPSHMKIIRPQKGMKTVTYYDTELESERSVKVPIHMNITGYRNRSSVGHNFDENTDVSPNSTEFNEMFTTRNDTESTHSNTEVSPNLTEFNDIFTKRKGSSDTESLDSNFFDQIFKGKHNRNTNKQESIYTNSSDDPIDDLIDNYMSDSDSSEWSNIHIYTPKTLTASPTSSNWSKKLK